MTERPLDHLIDDVALGLATEAETAELEEMALHDRAIAARLDRVRQNFAPLDDTADDLPLPEGFWDRLAVQLDGASGLATKASDLLSFAGLRRSLHLWRWTALGGMATAGVMAAALIWVTVQAPTRPAVIAVLLDAQGAAVALVEGSQDNTTRITLLERPDLPQHQVMQVWTKPDAAGLAVSLGLLPDTGPQTLKIDGLPAPRADQLYEITFEPEGGSPTNLPTGPILGKGLAKEPAT